MPTRYDQSECLLECIAKQQEKIHAVGGRIVVDATFGPPPLQDPFLQGADCELDSVAYVSVPVMTARSLFGYRCFPQWCVIFFYPSSCYLALIIASNELSHQVPWR